MTSTIHNHGTPYYDRLPHPLENHPRLGSPNTNGWHPLTSSFLQLRLPKNSDARRGKGYIHGTSILVPDLRRTTHPVESLFPACFTAKIRFLRGVPVFLHRLLLHHHCIASSLIFGHALCTPSSASPCFLLPALPKLNFNSNLLSLHLLSFFLRWRFPTTTPPTHLQHQTYICDVFVFLTVFSNLLISAFSFSFIAV